MKKKIAIIALVVLAAIGYAKTKAANSIFVQDWHRIVLPNGCTSCSFTFLPGPHCDPATFIPECGRSSD